MDTRNAHADHIGLTTVDRNTDHVRWPCVAHPPELSCEEAVRAASRRGFRNLEAQRRVPAREWVEQRR